jgi:hypothetical protein
MNETMPARDRVSREAALARAAIAPALCSMKSRWVRLPAWLALTVFVAAAAAPPALAALNGGTDPRPTQTQTPPPPPKDDTPTTTTTTTSSVPEMDAGAAAAALALLLCGTLILVDRRRPRLRPGA